MFDHVSIKRHARRGFTLLFLATTLSACNEELITGGVGGVGEAQAVSLSSPVGKMKTPWRTRYPAERLGITTPGAQAKPLSAYRGKFVLVNVWATWCYSCRVEMKDLDNLQSKFSKRDLLVMPLSVDRGGAAAVNRFYAKVGIKNLRTYNADGRLVIYSFSEEALPFTVLLDPTGKEIGRVIGPVKWNSNDFVQLIRQHLSQWKTDKVASN